ncbi:hypothetical protein Taro_013555 [Colocasia esculenta]|uniref:Uncharacterized protein n=1 Tax=Colocasia esculenta TaxID=4460 RepID=A0A843UGT3_COLES|nr:hypothetical protein [Colocasia esculenta]
MLVIVTVLFFLLALLQVLSMTSASSTSPPLRGVCPLLGDAAGSGGRSSGGGEGNRVGGEGQSASPSSSSVPVQGLGMGMGLPDPRQMKKKGRQTNTPGGAPPKGVSHASEALAMLTQQTQQAVLGLESTLGQGQRGGEDLDKEGIVEDFVKQFEEIAGSQDMESIVETMMQQLLSKEILHEPMKEIAERYPKWLEEHRDGLKPEDYDRYHHQYEIIRMLNEVYENDPDNFSKIIELMQKMQECGQPPNDIVQELAPDLDLTNLGQIRAMVPMVLDGEGSPLMEALQRKTSPEEKSPRPRGGKRGTSLPLRAQQVPSQFPIADFYHHFACKEDKGKWVDFYHYFACKEDKGK